jgi:hypothetical protein
MGAYATIIAVAAVWRSQGTEHFCQYGHPAACVALSGTLLTYNNAVVASHSLGLFSPAPNHAVAVVLHEPIPTLQPQYQRCFARSRYILAFPPKRVTAGVTLASVSCSPGTSRCPSVGAAKNHNPTFYSALAISKRFFGPCPLKLKLSGLC